MYKRKETEDLPAEIPDPLGGILCKDVFNDFSSNLGAARRTPLGGFVNVNKTVNKTFLYIGYVNNNVNKTHPGNVNINVNKKGFIKGVLLTLTLTLTKGLRGCSS